MTYRYGDIVHYRWGGDGKLHQSSMVIGETRDFRLLLIPLADTHLRIESNWIVSKAPDMWEPCTYYCPHNPGYLFKFIKENV
jgi:hypothetical protein